MARAVEKHTVELNMEESGILCHLLMRAILDMQRASRTDDGGFLGRMPEFEIRMGDLYEKLADANDRLMGKT